jgi:hypothetical protein
MSGISRDKGPQHHKILAEIKSPYRIPAEIEKEIQPTWFEILKEWFKNLDSDSIFLALILSIFGTFFILIIFAEISSCNRDVEVKNHGVSVCQKDHYVKTEYPAVELTKIICLSANGEEKNVYEEISK